MSFIERPQSALLRSALFQVHLWLGVITGLYIFVVCVTGAALVFRIDLQRALHPYLDQYSGEMVTPAAAPARGAGDMVMRWVSPLHVGNFGGNGIRVAWLLLGLAPPMRFATGFIMWWTRVVRTRWRRARQLGSSTSRAKALR